MGIDPVQPGHEALRLDNQVGRSFSVFIGDECVLKKCCKKYKKGKRCKKCPD